MFLDTYNGTVLTSNNKWKCSVSPSRALQISNTNMTQGSISIVNNDARYHI